MLHDDPLLDELIRFGLALLVFLPTAALSGHIIAHRVRKNLERFGEMTRRQTFFFGMYCVLSVWMSCALVGVPIILVLTLARTYL